MPYPLHAASGVTVTRGFPVGPPPAATTLRASPDATLTDAEDGLLGLRPTHALQMPATVRLETHRPPGQREGGEGRHQPGCDRQLTSTGKRRGAAWGSCAARCEVAANPLE